jgi:hypothetical protein
MRDLNHELKQLSQRNRDGSYSTRHARERALSLMANQLAGAGFVRLSATSLKPKHVDALVDIWKAESLSAGTMKNRMAHLRWWAERIGKPNIIARSNEQYGIADRQFVTETSKSLTLHEADLAKISDPYTAMSLRLQAAFGLRREESIKIRPAWADRGDKLVLKGSWTKGGRSREIPIRNEEQRRILDQAKTLAGSGSLIPEHRSYIDQLRHFQRQTADADIRKVHGLRHAYAHQRYRELTGWAAPAAGGPRSDRLTEVQRVLDREARMTISEELGHEREQVTAVYLGR